MGGDKDRLASLEAKIRAENRRRSFQKVNGAGETAKVGANFVGLYDFQKTLGKGHYATVKLAEHVFTGAQVAVKIVDKSKLDEESAGMIPQEVRCMKIMRHRNIVRLYEVVDTPNYLFLILELAGGGDLYDYITEKGSLSERRARRYFRQVLSAVAYCHRNRIVHRDLKPENFLLVDGRVKVTDFGFSNEVAPDKHMETMCGSLAYSAPEILLGDAYDGPAADMWSLGVCLYFMLTGALPFDDANQSEQLTKIMDAKYEPPSGVSKEGLDMLSCMLTRDPARRKKSNELLSHPWFKSMGSNKTRAQVRRRTSEDTQSVISVDTMAGPPGANDVVQEDGHVQNFPPEIHEVVLSRLEDIGIPREEVETSLKSGAYDHVAATYSLLASQVIKVLRQRARRASMARMTGGSEDGNSNSNSASKEGINVAGSRDSISSDGSRRGSMTSIAASIERLCNQHMETLELSDPGTNRSMVSIASSDSEYIGSDHNLALSDRELDQISDGGSTHNATVRNDDQHNLGGVDKHEPSKPSAGSVPAQRRKSLLSSVKISENIVEEETDNDEQTTSKTSIPEVKVQVAEVPEREPEPEEPEIPGVRNSRNRPLSGHFARQGQTLSTFAEEGPEEEEEDEEMGIRSPVKSVSAMADDEDSEDEYNDDDLLDDEALDDEDDLDEDEFEEDVDVMAEKLISVAQRPHSVTAETPTYLKMQQRVTPRKDTPGERRALDLDGGAGESVSHTNSLSPDKDLLLAMPTVSGSAFSEDDLPAESTPGIAGGRQKRHEERRYRAKSMYNAKQDGKGAVADTQPRRKQSTTSQRNPKFSLTSASSGLEDTRSEMSNSNSSIRHTPASSSQAVSSRQVRDLGIGTLQHSLSWSEDDATGSIPRLLTSLDTLADCVEPGTSLEVLDGRTSGDGSPMKKQPPNVRVRDERSASNPETLPRPISLPPRNVRAAVGTVQTGPFKNGKEDATGIPGSPGGTKKSRNPLQGIRSYDVTTGSPRVVERQFFRDDEDAEFKMQKRASGRVMRPVVGGSIPNSQSSMTPPINDKVLSESRSNGSGDSDVKEKKGKKNKTSKLRSKNKDDNCTIM
eukprot:Clim_evm5s88 gene=Clim_evmTU5s88